MMTMNKQAIRINVLAYNEADFIENCLNSINKALTYLDVDDFEVNVFCNGCKDNSFAIAKSYCQDKNGWRSFNIPLADKANAWNYALYQGKERHMLTIFLDGDCLIEQASLAAFVKMYESHTDSYILAAIPATKGRTTQITIDNTLKGEALSGNFYALTPVFLYKAFQEGFRLPIGLIGDDSLLAWVASHDFRLSNGVINSYLIGCEKAKFHYYRLTPSGLKNIFLYIRRLSRYSLRHIQQHAIKEYLTKHDDFGMLPKYISSLYSYVQFKHLRLTSLYNCFDIINYCLIRKQQPLKKEVKE